jgi:hypothetical protein
MDRKGRFFKYFKLDEDGNIQTTESVIGKNHCQNFGKRIATILQLPNATNYTGHCWRHTAVNICGDKNMSADQICVNVTGKIR